MTIQDSALNLSRAEERDLFPSLATAIREDAERKKPSPGLARDISQYQSRRNSADGLPLSGGIVIPLETAVRVYAKLYGRSQNATTFTAGGFVVSEDVQDMVEILRPLTTVLRMGARLITGATGNQRVPLQATESDWAWYSEGETVQDSAITGAALALTPKRCASRVSFTRQLGAQTDQQIAALLLSSFLKGWAVALDAACLSGSGIAGEPLGIRGQAGTASVTFGGAAVWQDVLDIEKAILDANGLAENIGWVAATDVKSKWKSIQRFANTAPTLWGSDSDTVSQYRAAATTNLAAGQLVAGDWSRYVIQTFGQGTPMQLLVNPYTDDALETVWLTATAYADCGAVTPGVFVIPTDSAAQ